MKACTSLAQTGVTWQKESDDEKPKTFNEARLSTDNFISAKCRETLIRKKKKKKEEDLF